MKRKHYQDSPMKISGGTREGEVQREIENFLRALSSYPEHFARDPYLSFEQHLFSGRRPRAVVDRLASHGE